MPRTRHRRAGFTLLELMIVVTIIGVLAAIAIPAFIGYTYRARTSEAYTMLASIRSHQSTYRAERGRFCGDLPWNPTATAPSQPTMFDTTEPNWAQLGARPDGPTRFHYRVTVGTPATASGIAGLAGDFWYFAQAEADLDQDGQTMVIEAYSAQRQVYVSRGVGGPYLTAGWE